MNLKIQIKRRGMLGKFLDATTGPDALRNLNHASIAEVQHVTEAHLWRLARRRHDTASALGAPPSNHLAQAAEKVAQADAIGSDSTAGTLTINHPGLGRAFHDVTIVPKEAKALAIPVNALAYAHRPREIWDRYNLFIARNGKGSSSRGVIMRKGPGGIAIAMYVLVRSVTQKQDRSLLPSDDDFTKAATRGALRFIKTIQAQAEANLAN